MIQGRVPQYYPTLSERDWFAIKKWHVNVGDYVHPGDKIVEIECPVGPFLISANQLSVLTRVVQILVQEGESTALGAPIFTLEPVPEISEALVRNLSSRNESST